MGKSQSPMCLIRSMGHIWTLLKLDFPELMTRFTCITMGDILTFGDLPEGQDDLDPCMLVDPI